MLPELDPTCSASFWTHGSGNGARAPQRPLGLTRNAIRAHLTTLERDGLVQRVGHRPGVGKPSSLYELTTAAEQSFSQAYAPCYANCWMCFASSCHREAWTDLLREVGRRMANEQGLADADLAERLARA